MNKMGLFKWKPKAYKGQEPLKVESFSNPICSSFCKKGGVI